MCACARVSMCKVKFSLPYHSIFCIFFQFFRTVCFFSSVFTKPWTKQYEAATSTATVSVLDVARPAVNWATDMSAQQPASTVARAPGRPERRASRSARRPNTGRNDALATPKTITSQGRDALGGKGARDGAESRN
eukprot:TRINITY_DN1192_c0_g1_i2.p1 TRINITY_DN1192_c0_g1~~TRINITY_DN1192_c0_g1_i2.p1  ORF type:complete len:155 (+),score=25.60 TRINITY_DN1192_c0_g1_i2:63-467(+)